MENIEFQKYLEETRAAISKLPDGAYEMELRLQVLMLQLLAKGKSVPADDLSAKWNLPLEQTNSILDQAAQLGTIERDDQGNLVASALSLLPTSHSLVINGKQLFAWCAYDAIYAPGVIGAQIVIESKDPYSQEKLHMTVGPNGIQEFDPATMVISVVGLGADSRGGAKSPRCQQMNFFASAKNAEKWIQEESNVVLMSPEQLFEMANIFQIQPARKMGLLD